MLMANITRQKAALAFPNDYFVWLAPKQGGNDSVGDVVFKGTAEDAWEYTEGKEPLAGYSFHMLYGVNIREMSPLEVKVICDLGC